MTRIKSFAVLAAVATLAFAATDLSASAQSSLTNGPHGTQPNRLASDTVGSPNGEAPSRAMMRRHALSGRTHRMSRTAERPVTSAYRRPLTVRRTVAAAEQPVVAAPAVAGPGMLVTGPLGFASNVVSLPFRAVGGIFPATGDITTNPLVIIGAPLRAIGDIVQLPFRIIGAPFGGTNIATY